MSGRKSRKAKRRQPAASPWARLRTPLILAAGAAGLLLVLFVLLNGPPAAAYSCSTELTPPEQQEDTSGLGFSPPYLGNTHIFPAGTPINYGFCPPASGNHYAAENRGPIPARVYQANQEQPPGGWVHNLEHGSVVLLYRCPGGQIGTEGCPSTAEFGGMQQWFDAQPQVAACGKQSLVARFDQMETRFALVAWNRVLLFDQLDMEKALTFAEQWTDAPTAPEATLC